MNPIEKLEAERAALVTEFESLIDDDGTAPEARVAVIEAKIADIDTRIERAVKLDAVREAAKDPLNVISNETQNRRPATSGSDPWRGGTFDTTGEDLNSRARAAIERWPVEDSSKEAATRGVESLDPKYGGREAAAHLTRITFRRSRNGSATRTASKPTWILTNVPRGATSVSTATRCEL